MPPARGIALASTTEVITRVLLVRHAATDGNRHLCGSSDIPLSAEGCAQLAILIERLRGRQAPDLLVTSPLRRARQVAEALGCIWNQRPEPAAWARELCCGDVDGMTVDDIRRDHPDLWTRNEAQDDDQFAWPGGETYAGFRARILDGLNQTAASRPGRRIVVVTHAGVISQILGVLRGRPASVWAPDRPAPLSATEISWYDGAPREILRFDDSSWC